MNGEVVNPPYTVMSSRSVAENVQVIVGESEYPYSGTLIIADGKLQDSTLRLVGESLVHSAELTTLAFTRGYLGDWGQYIVSIGLLLFAFSTAIAWSYYGDRAMTYLLGPKSVMPYRVCYVAGFFWASFADTTLIWNVAAVAVVLMTLPNLLAIVLLRGDMKETVNTYWQQRRSGSSSRYYGEV